MYRGMHRNRMRPELSLSAIAVGLLLIVLGGLGLVANGSLDAYVRAADVCPATAPSSSLSPAVSSSPSAAPSTSAVPSTSASACPAASSSASLPAASFSVSLPAASSSASLPAATETPSPSESTAPQPSESTGADVPGAPTDITATGGYSSIKVSWAAPEPNGVTITGYRASASPGPGTCTAGPTDTSCVIGAVAGMAYTVSVVALSAGGSSPASAESDIVVATEPAVSSTAPDASLPLDSGNGPLTTVAPGQTLILKGSGYAPYSTVTLVVYSSPRVLATVRADRRGAFAEPVTVPAGLPAGTHSFVAAGVDKDGKLRVLRLDLTVSAGGAPGSLPITGPAVIWLIVAGFAMTATGVAMRLVRRQ